MDWIARDGAQGILWSGYLRAIQVHPAAVHRPATLRITAGYAGTKPT